MTWLLAKIWISVGGAALLGLLIGWAWRGLGLKGKAHRAQAERDLAIADRDQLRAEVDALHAARREEARAVPANTNGGMLPDPRQLKSEIEMRDQRLKALTDELARSKDELETLKTKPRAEPAPATPVSMATGAALGVVAGGAAAATAPSGRSARDVETELNNIQKQRDDLAWRNRYLESRVALLEQNISRPVDPSAQPVAEPAVPGGEKAQMIAQLEELKSQNSALAKQLEEAKAGAETNRPGAAANDSEKDQELARLRWRNRYLESRLDYLEGSKTVETAAEDAQPAPAAPAPVAETQPEPEAETVVEEAVEAAPEPSPEPSERPQPEAEAAEPAAEAAPEPAAAPAGEDTAPQTEAAAEPAPEPEPEEVAEVAPPAPEAEAVAEEAPAPEAAATDGEPPAATAGPLRLDAPRDGQPDPLQAVEGIGPLIEQVLNGLGIYHIDQIAAWSDADAEWINQQLGFPGRVQRENWIGRARELITAG